VNVYSRYQEHQADQYGLEVLHGVVPEASAAAAGSLQILGDEDLEEPSPSPAVVFWFYTHPPIRDRIAFAYEYNPWDAGRSPEFVK
jgi:STE24 endopeptidase